MQLDFVRMAWSTLLAATFAGALGSLQLPVHAQKGLTDPVFEVVSIKRNKDDGTLSGSWRFLPDGSFTARMIPAALLALAFPEFSPHRIVNTPGWALVDSYDIEAKGDPSVPKPTPAQFASMLRKLFVERFGLQTHNETREQSVLVLTNDVNARDGVKLIGVATDCDKIRAATGIKGTPQTGPVPSCFARSSRSRFEGDATVDDLAAYLRVLLREDVVNKTSLKGYYRFALTVSSDGPLPRDGAPAVGSLSAGSVDTALREQTGLRLKAGRASVSVMVIDRFNRPTPN